MTTTPARLLEQKQQLVERLHEDSGPEERERVEQLLAKINKAMDLLDGAGVSAAPPLPPGRNMHQHGRPHVLEKIIRTIIAARREMARESRHK